MVVSVKSCFSLIRTAVFSLSVFSLSVLSSSNPLCISDNLLAFRLRESLWRIYASEHRFSPYRHKHFAGKGIFTDGYDGFQSEKNTQNTKENGTNTENTEENGTKTENDKEFNVLLISPEYFDPIRYPIPSEVDAKNIQFDSSLKCWTAESVWNLVVLQSNDHDFIVRQAVSRRVTDDDDQKLSVKSDKKFKISSKRSSVTSFLIRMDSSSIISERLDFGKKLEFDENDENKNFLLNENDENKNALYTNFLLNLIQNILKTNWPVFGVVLYSTRLSSYLILWEWFYRNILKLKMNLEPDLEPNLEPNFKKPGIAELRLQAILGIPIMKEEEDDNNFIRQSAAEMKHSTSEVKYSTPEMKHSSSEMKHSPSMNTGMNQLSSNKKHTGNKQQLQLHLKELLRRIDSGGVSRLYASPRRMIRDVLEHYFFADDRNKDLSMDHVTTFSDNRNKDLVKTKMNKYEADMKTKINKYANALIDKVCVKNLKWENLGLENPHDFEQVRDVICDASRKDMVENYVGKLLLGNLEVNLEIKTRSGSSENPLLTKTSIMDTIFETDFTSTSSSNQDASSLSSDEEFSEVTNLYHYEDVIEEIVEEILLDTVHTHNNTNQYRVMYF